MSDAKENIVNNSPDKDATGAENNSGSEELEERALSVFASERNEDITALVLSLITTFIVLLFTKWL